MCSNDIKEEILKMHKISKPSKNYHEHSNSGSIKNNDKTKNNDKNEIKYGNSDLKYGNNETIKSKGEKNNKDTSSGHSVHGGSNKNIYKGKVKSEFGGT